MERGLTSLELECELLLLLLPVGEVLSAHYLSAHDDFLDQGSPLAPTV